MKIAFPLKLLSKTTERKTVPDLTETQHVPHSNFELPPFWNLPETNLSPFFQTHNCYIMVAEDGNIEVTFYLFPEGKLSFYFCLSLLFCCPSELMEARFTSATYTLRTPAPIPASPKMRPAWTRTSLRSLLRTLRAKLVCISHDVSVCFFLFLFYSGGKWSHANGALNNLSCQLLIVYILWCCDEGRGVMVILSLLSVSWLESRESCSFTLSSTIMPFLFLILHLRLPWYTRVQTNHNFY